jgi:predicted nucleic acid-binding Zn ribbon protein
MRTCEVCGKELLYQRRYCSRACFKEGNKEQRICDTCGKPYWGPSYANYCSIKCRESQKKEYYKLAHKRNFERTKIEREVDRIQVDRFFKAFESSGYRETMPVVAFIIAIVQTADTAGMHGRYAKRRDEVKKLQKFSKNHLTNEQEAL